MQHLPFSARPEDAGVSSRGILGYIAGRAEMGIEPHAVWVLRHGQVAARLCFAPYDDQTPHMLFSLSKSFCSAAAGFAVQEGLLHWDSKLIDVLPEIFPEEPSDWQKMITMHHLLTMGSGHCTGRAVTTWRLTQFSSVAAQLWMMFSYAVNIALKARLRVLRSGDSIYLR